MTQPPPLPPMPSEESPKACVRCGAVEFSTATNLPVCDPCRIALVRRGFPIWVKISSLVIILLLGYSATQVPARLERATQFKLAEKLASAGEWDAAYEQFKLFKPEARRADDLGFTLDYAEAALMSGHLDEAQRTLIRLVGKRAPRNIIERAEQLSKKLEKKMHQQGQFSVQPTS